MRLADYDHMPSVAALMTPFPYSVRLDEPIARAVSLMREHDIRHIPVREGDRVVGVVSEGDLRGCDASGRVRDVQVTSPYTVDMGTSLADVLREMAARGIGTALVVRSEKLAGIVTATDVCRALAAILESRFGPRGGDAA
ncbi:MAG TPA: CBS domain-containing protein [Myxococcota bacterium]|jgi:acetoin utilization protein AcuB|nr:CBS domain-containing protein [Myxococcota bacterium]